MKTIRIHLQGVEEAMLLEVQKRNQRFRDLEALLVEQIRQEYQRIKR
jgi:hypothetical protein